MLGRFRFALWPSTAHCFGACSGLPPLSGPVPVDEDVGADLVSGAGFCGWYGFGAFGSVRSVESWLFNAPVGGGVTATVRRAL